MEVVAVLNIVNTEDFLRSSFYGSERMMGLGEVFHHRTQKMQNPSALEHTASRAV